MAVTNHSNLRNILDLFLFVATRSDHLKKAACCPNYAKDPGRHLPQPAAGHPRCPQGLFYPRELPGQMISLPFLFALIGDPEDCLGWLVFNCHGAVIRALISSWTGTAQAAVPYIRTSTPHNRSNHQCPQWFPTSFQILWCIYDYCHF